MADINIGRSSRGNMIGRLAEWVAIRKAFILSNEIYARSAI
jgi:hypothetical protein